MKKDTCSEQYNYLEFYEQLIVQKDSNDVIQ